MLFHNRPITLEFSECMDDHPGFFWGLNTTVHVCEYVCLCVCVCVSLLHCESLLFSSESRSCLYFFGFYVCVSFLFLFLNAFSGS